MIKIIVEPQPYSKREALRSKILARRKATIFRVIYLGDSSVCLACSFVACSRSFEAAWNIKLQLPQVSREQRRATSKGFQAAELELCCLA